MSLQATKYHLGETRPHTAPSRRPLLEAKSIRRTFGETIALDACSVSVAPGEIHAVVGENGSGKSTLIKILSGIVGAESGTLEWNGEPLRVPSPRAAQAAGIATVFQETLILPEMSVRDNVVLGLDGVVQRKANPTREAELVREALAIVGMGGLDIEKLAGALSLASRQLVGVARSLLRPWRLLILDESTSAIDIEDRDRLFEALRTFRGEGRSILFVSHRMDEIDSLADRATVLRSGQSVATLERGFFSSEKLLELMSSRERSRVEKGPRAYQTRGARGQPLVTIRGLSVRKGRPAFDFDLYAGEIVGVGGLEGHGQVTFLECVAGSRRPATGAVHARDAQIRSERDAARSKIAFLPRDRKTEGILAPLSILDNVTISSLTDLARWGVLRWGHRHQLADDVCRDMKVKMADLRSPIASLSGGNQQKALLGRLIATKPRVLVLNDPMRGVDLGAKGELYEVLVNVAASGVAILLLSTELIELCFLCDRVAVFHDHEISAIIEQDSLDERTLIDAMFARRKSSIDAVGSS
jgi:ABC-type sugar transport system ATPase subunit